MPVVSFAYRVTSGGVGSGSIGNNAVLSGNIASGQVGQFKLSSGTVNSGHIGNNAVVSGSIASGQIGLYHIASGVIQSGTTLQSGIVTSGYIGNSAVVSGSIASGSISQFKLSSGAINSGQLGNNAIVSGNIASGQIGGSHLASGVINKISGNLNVSSGSVTVNTVVINSAIFSGLTSTTTVYSGSISIGMAAYFDYATKNTLTSGYRAGTVTTIWDSTNETTEHNDMSTQDLGGSTIGLSFSSYILSGNLQLDAQISSGSFNLKLGARFI